jgi:hypothetical protein
LVWCWAAASRSVTARRRRPPARATLVVASTREYQTSRAPLRLVAFFVLLLAVRGVPALFLYRRDLPAVRRVQLMLLTATALPLLVALAEIGLRNGTMLRENAAALVGAGALSVLVFPMVAVAIERRRRAGAEAASAPSGTE